MKSWLTFAGFWAGCVFTVLVIDWSRDLIDGDIDKLISEGVFHKIRFEGHDYVMYEVGRNGSRMGGFDHDPSCLKCKAEKP